MFAVVLFLPSIQRNILFEVRFFSYAFSIHSQYGTAPQILQTIQFDSNDFEYGTICNSLSMAYIPSLMEAKWNTEHKNHVSISKCCECMESVKPEIKWRCKRETIYKTVNTCNSNGI